MNELFQRALREGKWLRCRYQNLQNLWFSPSELAAEQAAGRFRWGPENWELRDPEERLDELEKAAKTATLETFKFRARLLQSRPLRPIREG